MIPPLKQPGFTSKNSRVVHPHIRVGMTFYPHTDPVFNDRSSKARKVIWDGKKTHGSLMSFTWTKTLGKPSGTWTATIKHVHEYDLNIENGDILPDDWVDISILRNGIEFPLCRGIVDSVTDTTRGVGTTVKTYLLTGRDHGAPLEYPIVYTNIYAQSMTQLVSGLMTKRLKDGIGRSPSYMFKLLLDAAFKKDSSSNTASWEFPPSLSNAIKNYNIYSSDTKAHAWEVGQVNAPNNYLWQVLKYKNSTLTRGGYTNELQLWTQAGQNLYQTLNQWCNPLLNELYTDIDIPSSYTAYGTNPINMAAIIRERPFLFTDSNLEYTNTDFPGEKIQASYNSPWFKLKTWELPNWMVLDSNLTRSGQERFNIFHLLADVGLGQSEGDQIPQSPPYWYKESMQKYGIRFIQRETRFVQNAQQGKGFGQWLGERKKWQKMLVEWYCLNPYFRSGTIGFKTLFPEIHIGEKLRINTGKIDTSETFYVEGLTFTYNYNNGKPSGTSSFTVTRGYHGKDSKLVQDTKKMSDKFTILTKG